MKNVLIPMDFTSISINALKYAIDCFSGSKLFIYHVRTGILDTNESVGISMALSQADFWKKSIKSFVSKELGLPTFPETIEVIVDVGTVNLSINTFAKKNNIDCIVMGTRDKYNFVDKWFGTFSLAVIKESDIPVYVIPRYAQFGQHKKIMIASDYNSGDAVFLDKIKSWNQTNRAHLHFLHIQDKSIDDYDKTKEKIVQHLFEESDVEFSFEIEVLQEKDVTHAILATAYNKAIDLLIVVPEKQNFIQSILLKSVSKELIMQSEIPILFINK
jgi:nucleotide-binding universal stress UspA family protein